MTGSSRPHVRFLQFYLRSPTGEKMPLLLRPAHVHQQSSKNTLSYLCIAQALTSNRLWVSSPTCSSLFAKPALPQSFRARSLFTVVRAASGHESRYRQRGAVSTCPQHADCSGTGVRSRFASCSVCFSVESRVFSHQGSVFAQSSSIIIVPSPSSITTASSSTALPLPLISTSGLTFFAGVSFPSMSTSSTPRLRLPGSDDVRF